MTKKEKDLLWLGAIDTLIEYYKEAEEDEIPESYGITHHPQPCPLCETKHRIAEDEDLDCLTCPWVRFEGHNCEDRGLDKNYRAFEDYPAGDRLKRLRRWKRKLEGST